MPIITFVPSGKKIEVKSGTTLYTAAVSAGLPVAASCSADFICGKCNMQVVHGADQLSKQTLPEIKLLRREKKIETDRISCKTSVYGDCTVSTTYW